MSQNIDNGPVVKTETGTPTLEHRKAGRAGQIALGSALLVLIVSGVAALAGLGAVALTAAGFCVALVVIGLMLHYEGERQRQRPDSARPRYGREELANGLV